MTLFPANKKGEKCLFTMTTHYTKKRFASVIVNAKKFDDDNDNLFELNLSYNQILNIINDLQSSVDFYHKLKSKSL
jgi:hypothetical protein